MNLNKILEYLKNNNTVDGELKQYYDEIITFKQESFIPAVSYEIALFLRWFSQLLRPVNILEIGFGSGVSSLFIRNGFENYKNFITLERDNYRFSRGKQLLEKYNVTNINLMNINAFSYFSECNIKFDYIFLDAVKREYYQYIEPVKKILNKNGILICDNILFGGRIVNDNNEKKYVNGVTYLKLFNEMINNDKNFNTMQILIGDGLLLSIRQ